jgi:hypothetical protein
MQLAVSPSHTSPQCSTGLLLTPLRLAGCAHPGPAIDLLAGRKRWKKPCRAEPGASQGENSAQHLLYVKVGSEK